MPSMKMIIPNSMAQPMYAARSWSREERELNAYLAREWQFRPHGTRSRCRFCSGNENHVRPVHRRREVPTKDRVRPRTRAAAIISALLVLLRTLKTGQGREIG